MGGCASYTVSSANWGSCCTLIILRSVRVWAESGARALVLQKARLQNTFAMNSEQKVHDLARAALCCRRQPSCAFLAASAELEASQRDLS